MSEAAAEQDRLTGILRNKLFATTKELAAILRCDPRTVQRMIDSGEIPAFKTGRVYRIRTSWIRQHTGMGAEPGPLDPITAGHLRIRRELGAVDA
jgi:excisionase family DNA binding protein